MSARLNRSRGSLGDSGDGKVTFCGHATAVKGTKKFYGAVHYNTFIIKVGDAVELRNPGGIPHIGCVEDIFRKARGEPSMTVRWFYRISDFQPEEKIKGQWEDNEVFVSDHTDVNPIRTIVNKCIVHSPGAAPLRRADGPDYICSKRYLVGSQPPRFEPLTKAELLDGNRQLANLYDDGQPIIVRRGSGSDVSENSSDSDSETSTRSVQSSTTPASIGTTGGKARLTSSVAASAAPANDSNGGDAAAAGGTARKRKSRNSGSSDYGLTEFQHISEGETPKSRQTSASRTAAAAAGAGTAEVTPFSNAASNQITDSAAQPGEDVKQEFVEPRIVTDPRGGRPPTRDPRTSVPYYGRASSSESSERLSGATPIPNDVRRSRPATPISSIAPSSSGSIFRTNSQALETSSPTSRNQAGSDRAALQLRTAGNQTANTPAATRVSSSDHAQSVTEPRSSMSAEVPMDANHHVLVQQFRTNQLEAVVTPISQVLAAQPSAPALGSLSIPEGAVPVTPLSTKDGPISVQQCLRTLNAIAQASLIPPNVRDSVTKLLLGTQWDNILAVWAISALDLCAQDNDLQDCAESLNMLFAPGDPVS